MSYEKQRTVKPSYKVADLEARITELEKNSHPPIPLVEQVETVLTPLNKKIEELEKRVRNLEGFILETFDPNIIEFHLGKKRVQEWKDTRDEY